MGRALPLCSHAWLLSASYCCAPFVVLLIILTSFHGFQKTDQTLCHFETWRKTGQRGDWGMGAAHCSPTQPPEGREADRGGEDRGEGCTRSLQAGKAPRSPQAGVRTAQIPPAPPPALLEPESVSLTARPSSPFERAPAFALSPGKTGESGAPQARILSSRSLLSFPFPTRL